MLAGVVAEYQMSYFIIRFGGNKQRGWKHLCELSSNMIRWDENQLSPGKFCSLP